MLVTSLLSTQVFVDFEHLICFHQHRGIPAPVLSYQQHRGTFLHFAIILFFLQRLALAAPLTWISGFVRFNPWATLSTVPAPAGPRLRPARQRGGCESGKDESRIANNTLRIKSQAQRHGAGRLGGGRKLAVAGCTSRGIEMETRYVLRFLRLTIRERNGQSAACPPARRRSM